MRCLCRNKRQGLQHLLAAKLSSVLFFLVNWFQNSFVGFFLKTDVVGSRWLYLFLMRFGTFSLKVLMRFGAFSSLSAATKAAFFTFLKHGTVTAEMGKTEW